jgi:hypothetical protein
MAAGGDTDVEVSKLEMISIDVDPTHVGGSANQANNGRV